MAPLSAAEMKEEPEGPPEDSFDFCDLADQTVIASQAAAALISKKNSAKPPRK